ncbi:MAG TPA: hypothetical protein VMQ62_11820 [Dongiaceae bacterium]|nr:hypothetical protein [Dongiaceae bacterium]
MPNRPVVLLAVILLSGTLLGGTLDPDPTLEWYVDSVCPDDGIACTVEEAFYGQCRHRIDPQACRTEETRCAGESYCDPRRGGCVCRDTALVNRPDRPRPGSRPPSGRTREAAAAGATPGRAQSG